MKKVFWIKPIIFAAILLLIACKKEDFSDDTEYIPPHWPEVETLEITNATDTMATLNGSVNSNGLSTSVIFEYGTTTNYGNSVTASQSPVTGNSITNVSADISGLMPDSTYHFRVKAENQVWRNFYGDDIEFKSPILNVTHWGVTITTNTSATLRGQVDAWDLYTTVTFEYGTTTSYGNTIPAKENPVTQNGTYVNADISDLIPCETYHFRVKAVNSFRTRYSPDIVFIPSTKPTLTTTEVTDITATTTISGGSITNEGCLAIIDRGVMLGTREGGKPPRAIKWSTYTHDGEGEGNFTSILTGLSPSKTYYVKSYARTQEHKVYYGNVISFKTLP